MNHRDTCVDLLTATLGSREDAEALFSLATHEVQVTGFQAGWDAHMAAVRKTDSPKTDDKYSVHPHKLRPEAEFVHRTWCTECKVRT